MKAFGWKRKSGENIKKAASTAFERESKDEDDNEVSRGQVDWLTLAPKRRCISLEDAEAKSRRLKNEGAVLASAERFWEAMKKWDEALQLTPNDATLYEMKAQAFMQLCEVFPAVHAAQKAVNLNATWWVAYQTLGRAQLGMGEVLLGQRNFSKAIHINPLDQELWEEDLRWAHNLLKTNDHIKRKRSDAEDKQTTVSIVELDTATAEQTVDVYRGSQNKDQDEDANMSSEGTSQSLSKDYVHMRY